MAVGREQFNYKSAYDLAVQTAGATLPITFKFGTDKQPQYRKFTTLDELTDFYSKAKAYIQTTLAKGWKEKDAIDWAAYGKEEGHEQGLWLSYRDIPLVHSTVFQTVLCCVLHTRR